MSKRAGILVFPGINCERDTQDVLEKKFGYSCELLWHTESFHPSHTLYVIPGGFSYGDYLRSGAMAARSASVKSLRDAASKGIPVLGICNGFQILTEAHLLPGALVRNSGMKHICRWAELEGSAGFRTPEDFALPVSHGEGNYLCSDAELSDLKNSDSIFLRYRLGINGATDRIAGIRSANIYGLMPHPERAVYPQKNYLQSQSAGIMTFEYILGG